MHSSGREYTSANIQIQIVRLVDLGHEVWVRTRSAKTGRNGIMERNDERRNGGNLVTAGVDCVWSSSIQFRY